MMDEHVVIGDSDLSLYDVVKVARYVRKVAISTDAIEQMQRAWKWLQDSSGVLIYGLNTNIGALCGVQTIDLKSSQLLQRQILLNHVVGLGDPFDQEIVRAAMLFMAHYLCKGLSGVRPVVVETLVRMLNEGVIPVVPSQGSLGSSGDLVPLAYIALVISKNIDTDADEISGKAYYHGSVLSGKEAMAKAGISRILLEGIEGLALINGTWISSAIATLFLHDAIRLHKWSDIIAALSMEALGAFQSPFSPTIHKKTNPGQLATALNFVKLLEESQLSPSISEVQSSVNTVKEYHKIHDPYSVRCIPQVHGAAKEAISFASEVILREINGVSGSPVILSECSYLNKAISTGNFHGQYITMAMDLANMGLTYIASLSERRIYHLVYGGVSKDLPIGLVRPQDYDFGTLEIAHYVAASLLSESKTLCQPSSSGSIPVAANVEDYVSLATLSAKKAREIVSNTYSIFSIELLLSYKATGLRLAENPGMRLGRGTKACYDLISIIDGRNIFPIDVIIRDISEILQNDESVAQIESTIGYPLAFSQEMSVNP